ncbi:hypothetical protein [Marinactinospora rubrisoli]|uniref:Uncharacterized protein n=1 Tax=Marinactinospora rubrisoli TaxID=2715399 RepID=A0ABW2KGT8_9ACTN
MAELFGLALGAVPALLAGRAGGDPWVGCGVAVAAAVGLLVWYIVDDLADATDRLVTGAIVGVFGLVAVQVADTLTAPERGVVVEREYSPEHTSQSTSCTTTATGQTQCSTSTTHHPESWSLLLHDASDNGWWRDDSGWRSVEEAVYDRCQVGDRYPGCAGDAAGAD